MTAGRPPKNKSIEIQTSNGHLGKMYHIQVPYPVRVIIQPECYVNKEMLGDFKPTIPKIIMANIEDKEIIIENAQKNGVIVKEIEPMIFGPLLEICQKCGKKGVPSIQKKNTDQNYAKVRTSYHVDLMGEKISIPKPKTFWLVYKHNPGLCWVKQWQGTIDGTFKKSKRVKEIEPTKFLFSKQLKQLESISEPT